jgi:hypothetical protein
MALSGEICGWTLFGSGASWPRRLSTCCKASS